MSISSREPQPPAAGQIVESPSKGSDAWCRQEIGRYLQRLHHCGLPPQAILTSCSFRNGKPDHEHWLSLDAAARALAGKDDVYIAVGYGPRGAQFGPHGRANAGQIIGLSFLWADIDVKHSAHQKENLPPTIDDSLWLANSMGHAPSMIVHTGHGIHAYWVFRSPLLFTTDEERSWGLALARDWQHCIRHQAMAHGWAMDSTGDGARILRAPGTWNAKTPDDRKLARILQIDGGCHD
jgi:hypothetical protein